MLEEEVDEVVGPKGKWNRDRTAVRHGHDDGEVTPGGRRVAVRRPRVRTVGGEHEGPLESYEYFADRDPLQRVVLERMLTGVSTRRYRRTQEPVGEDVEAQARSTSKSSVSRTFVERARRALSGPMSRQLADLRLAVMMIDGIELKERMMIVALGVSTGGVKIPLGLWEGSTENATVATVLLADLVERGLDPERGCCSSWTGRRRRTKRCGPCSARSRSNAACVTKRGKRPITVVRRRTSASDRSRRSLTAKSTHVSGGCSQLVPCGHHPVRGSGCRFRAIGAVWGRLDT